MVEAGDGNVWRKDKILVVDAWDCKNQIALNLVSLLFFPFHSGVDDRVKCW